MNALKKIVAACFALTMLAGAALAAAPTSPARLADDAAIVFTDGGPFGPFTVRALSGAGCCCVDPDANGLV